MHSIIVQSLLTITIRWYTEQIFSHRAQTYIQLELHGIIFSMCSMCSTGFSIWIDFFCLYKWFNVTILVYRDRYFGYVKIGSFWTKSAPSFMLNGLAAFLSWHPKKSVIFLQYITFQSCRWWTRLLIWPDSTTSYLHHPDLLQKCILPT